MKRGPERVRFRRKTRRRKDGHIIWTGGVQFRMADGRRLSPSAAAYEITHGYRSPTGVAMRSCDVAGCVAHVEQARFGDAHRFTDNAKLTATQVAAVRGLDLSCDNRRSTLRDLAAEFGVSRSTVAQLRSRSSKTWRGIGR